MKIIAFLLILTAPLCAQVAPGMAEADLLVTKGAPTHKGSLGPRTIYDWPDMKVVVQGGFIIANGVTNKDPAADAADAVRRAKLADEAKKKQEEKKLAAAQALKFDQEKANAEAHKKIYAKSFLGKKAPDFIVEKWITPEPLMNNKYVLIDFWATWCEPCKRAIPAMNEIFHQFGDRLVVIGLSDEPEGTVRKMTDPKIDYFVATDPLARMKKTLKVEAIPHAILIDPAGIVRWEGLPSMTDHELTPKVVQKILDPYSN